MTKPNRNKNKLVSVDTRYRKNLVQSKNRLSNMMWPVMSLFLHMSPTGFIIHAKYMYQLTCPFHSLEKCTSDDDAMEEQLQMLYQNVKAFISRALLPILHHPYKEYNLLYSQISPAAAG